MSGIQPNSSPALKRKMTKQVSYGDMIEFDKEGSQSNLSGVAGITIG